MKERLLFVGIGQCGNNIVDGLLESDKEYKGILMNTSVNDILALKNNDKAYLIPNASGCAKNRKTAVKYVKENYNTMVNYISDKYTQQDIVYIIFSMGGGTGSGISPILASMLIRANPNKTYNLIGVLPRINGIKKRMLQNTIDCWNDITKLNNVDSLMIVDNNKRETDLDVNEALIEELNNFFNLGTHSNVMGAIDNEEVAEVATTKGFSYIYSFKNDKSFEDALMEEMNKSVFVGYQGESYKMSAISLINNYDVEEAIESLFGECLDVSHEGYNENKNVIVIAGAEPHNSFIGNYIYKLNKINEDNSHEFSKLNDLAIKDIEEPKKEIKKINKGKSNAEKLVESFGRKNLEDIFNDSLKDFE